MGIDSLITVKLDPALKLSSFLWGGFYAILGRNYPSCYEKNNVSKESLGLHFHTEVPCNFQLRRKNLKLNRKRKGRAVSGLKCRKGVLRCSGYSLTFISLQLPALLYPLAPLHSQGLYSGYFSDENGSPNCLVPCFPTSNPEVLKSSLPDFQVMHS